MTPALGDTRWKLPSAGTFSVGVALCALLIAVRTVGLGHYPALHPDEGFWASGARNAVRFGQPLLDGRLHPFLSPATFLALGIFFAFAPADLLWARIFSVALGLASCVLAVYLGRQCFKSRPWLFPLLCGLSSLVVMAQRMILLEAHLLFWLLLAAILLLRGGRYSSVLSGAALGVALLVKTSAVYCIPVFALALFWPLAAPGAAARGVPRPWNRLLLFLSGCVAIAAGGYLAAWTIDPAGFTAAFAYELDGVHFPNNGVLFRVGRFGLNPSLMLKMAWTGFLTEPILLPLGVIGWIRIIRRGTAISVADFFFALWMLCGTLFHFLQTNIHLHYLATLAPAYVYLVTRLLNDFLDAPPATTSAASAASLRRPLARTAVALICLFQVGRFAYGTLTHRETDYWQTVAYFGDHVPAAARVLAAPYINLSLPQKSYDYFRLLRPYDGHNPLRPLPGVVDQYGISFIIVDPEWYALEYSHEITIDRAFLADRCSRVAHIGQYEIFAVNPRAGRPVDAGAGPVLTASTPEHFPTSVR